jgi:hypothetical protein
MFRPMDKQLGLDEGHLWMPETCLERLKVMWPHIFRTQVLGMIPEAAFADLYADGHGRPNFPVAILVGLSVLKEMLDLTDEALMDSFRFDMRFHYALRLTLDDTAMAIRTLYYFRSRVVGSEAVGATFDAVVDRIIKVLELDISQQRKDSTHIRSNMAILTRLGLFTRTMENFIDLLTKGYPDQKTALPEEIQKRYGERFGRFADAKSSEGRRRLGVAATDLWFLVQRFRENEVIRGMPEYRLLERLLAEQCTVGNGDDDSPPVVLKKGKEIAADSLQSPFDQDASYDGHKGVGYQVQISETCAPGNPIQVITRVEVEPAHKSDQHALIPALDDLADRGCVPDTMFSDTSYNSGANLIAAAERGVNLMAPTPGKMDPHGINLGHFDLDLKDLQVCACPEGEQPIRDRVGADGETHNLLFDAQRCGPCDLALDCPAGKNGGRLRVHPEDIATAFSRAREETEAFKKEYAIRSGIESTNAECKTAHGLGKVWTRELPNVTFAATMKTLACNAKRFMRHQCAQILGKGVKMATNPA